MAKYTLLIDDDKPLSNGMEVEETRWRLPSLFWVPLIVCGGLLFVVDVFQLQYYTLPPTRTSIDYPEPPKSLQGFLIKTAGCRIPYMDPFDLTVTKFIKKEKRPVCNNGIPALFDANLTHIYLVESALPHYHLEELRCCYRPFHRREPKSNEGDDKIIFSEECFKFHKAAAITDEFIQVTCDNDTATVYQDFFSFVPIKERPPVLERQPLNVLIIGIDAVSRLNFHRQMPRTVQYLKNISAVELLGYNKVGDNTFPNLIPVLTGYNETELRHVCCKEDTDHFDDCPFIWNDFKTKGFLTAFGEDSSWMGIFNYVKRGFTKQPTDYMWGSFNRISEKIIGNSHNMNVNECVGAREVYKVFLDYIANFVLTMTTERLPYFGFFWGASLSHDYLNKPNLGDEDYLNFFRNITDYLNNTALIVMSDHGIRWGDIRQTYQGRMEERLPFIFMVLPDWYKKQYVEAYSNLVKNVRRLTTPFDLHETLRDFLDPYRLTGPFLHDRYKNNSRGYSLFNEISQKRSCEDADIASHWCTCQQSVEVDRNDSKVLESALFAVDHMNRQLEGYGQCANLTLHSISNARVMTHGDHILNGNETKDFMITLQTVPGDGVFEVTVRRTTVSDKTYQFEVMGTISRLNLYGQQSSCVTDFHLKLYCYCKSLL